MTPSVLPSSHSNIDGEEDVTVLEKHAQKSLLRRLGISFFLFGLINNVLYVLILSAALDLVPPSTPKGLILFCNIFPSLIAKVSWPYLLKGRIRYVKRLVGCCTLSTAGMLVVALLPMLWTRLLGISLASFASGLGELTFLQLSSRYHSTRSSSSGEEESSSGSPSDSLAASSVGYFASGTGAAGLVGAGMWWLLRGLGVRVGVGVACILPSIIPTTYFFLLPPSSAFLSPSSESAYAPLATADTEDPAVNEDDEEDTTLLRPSDSESAKGAERGSGSGQILTIQDKWRLVKPLLGRYMLPLFCVYLFEYTINQGISPTLIYPVPSPSSFLRHIIHSLRDYYPLYQLIYQSTVFLSRSSISFGLPPLPLPRQGADEVRTGGWWRRLGGWRKYVLWLPALVQGVLVVWLAGESAGVWPWGDGAGVVLDDGGVKLGRAEGVQGGKEGTIMLVMLLIAVEGVCGGLAYVNTFYHLTHSSPSSSTDSPQEELSQPREEYTPAEREFRIGSLGFADSTGILLASLLSMYLEGALCGVQKGRGRGGCAGM